MSQLVAISFPDEWQATDLLAAAKQLHDDGALVLEEAVTIIKDSQGRIKVEDTAGGGAAKGAVGGLVLGAVVGLILFAPVVGAVFGAASGALAGKMHDVGQIDDFRIQVAENLKPGTSAIIMLASDANPERALDMLSKYGGTLIRTSLDDDAEARIRAALAGAGTL